uniref:Glycosyltransferase family 1 protein n=1 Tax=Ignavibacterium album TaxID=591197 RepID=A0A7V2ZK50_9BACT
MKIKLAILNTHPIQYFAPLYKELAKVENIDLTVLYCSKWGVDTYIDPQFKTSFKWDIPLLDGYNYKFLKNVRKTQDVNKFFNLINLEIIPELLKKKYDVLWVNGHNNFTTIIAVITAKITGTKLFMRAETQLNVEPVKIKKLIRKPIMTFFYKLFDGFLYIGTRNKEYYKYVGVPDEKLFLVPYSVNNDFFISKVETAKRNKNELKIKYKLLNDNLNILYASKLMRRKNPLDLLKAYRIVKEKFRDVNVIFVGTGEEEKFLKHFIAENNIRDVYFFGFLNQSELPEVFVLSDIFVLPAVNEQWGLIINEAMCAGLPIITTNVVGAAPDLVKNGINGFTFNPGDINELAEKILVILNDEKLRKTMSEKSKEIISKWNYRECIDGIQLALKSVVK